MINATNTSVRKEILTDLVGEAHRLVTHADRLAPQQDMNFLAARSEANSMLRAVGIALGAPPKNWLDAGETYYNGWLLTSPETPAPCACPTCQKEQPVSG